MEIAEQQKIIQALRDFAVYADTCARRYGKTASPKLPIVPSQLVLVLRNVDENSRDEMGSINSIQTSIDIAVEAALRGYTVLGFKAQGTLNLQILPKPLSGKRKKRL